MKTLYWAWLHLLVVLVFSLFLDFLLVVYVPEYASAYRVVRSEAAALAWLSFLMPLLFTAYIRPYRWFWALWVAPFWTVPLYFSTLGGVLPVGQIEYWLSVELIPIWSAPAEGRTGRLPVVLAAAVALSLTIVLLLFKIRQLYWAGRRGHPKAVQEAGYTGRYTIIGICCLVAFAILACGPGILELLKARIFVGPPLAGSAGLPPESGLEILPEWFALFGYAILRSVPDKLGALAVLFLAFAAPLALPWLDKGPLRPVWRRSLYAPFVVLFLTSILGLFYLGATLYDERSLLFVRLVAAYYFLHILVVVPIVSRFEAMRASRTGSS